jgi:hypothetical protein
MKFGHGPEIPLAKIETWTLNQITTVMSKGRSVMVIFDSGTLKEKHKIRLQQEAVKVLGEPVTILSAGASYDQVYWSIAGETLGLSVGLSVPEDIMIATPSKTDVVRFAVPIDW